MNATNFKTTTAREDSPELQRYLKIWIFRALRQGPKTWMELIGLEGLKNQGVVYIRVAVNDLISGCSVVDDGHIYRFPEEGDVDGEDCFPDLSLK